MAPGAKFSTMTSARFAISLQSSRPRSDFRLTVIDFLLALNNRKYQESWPWPDDPPEKRRPASPPCGFSTLTTSAPSQASASVQDGPASNWVRSRTRTPASQSGSVPLVAIFSFLPARAVCLFSESSSRSSSFLEHDPLRKPVATFRDHALAARSARHHVDGICFRFRCLNKPIIGIGRYARREWPCGHRASAKRDRLAPPRLIEIAFETLPVRAGLQDIELATASQ